MSSTSSFACVFHFHAPYLFLMSGSLAIHTFVIICPAYHLQSIFSLDLVIMQSSLLLVWLLSAVISSHSDRLGPKLMGGSKLLAKLKSRNVFTQHQQIDVETVAERSAAPKSRVQPRQAQCGPGIGNCTAGLCCSIDG
jgi:hypothetical protein